MKKICLFLIGCIVLSCIGVFAADKRTAVINESERLANISFIPDKDPYTAANNVCIRALSGADPASEYDQPAFFKFDFSEYAGYAVNSVELVWKCGAKTSLRIYDVPDNSLNVTYDGTTPNRIKIGSLITAGAFDANSPVLTDRPGVPEGYNMSFDLTSYVKNKLSHGQTSFTVMIYSVWDGRYVFSPGGAKLWVDYSVNNKPEITVNSPSDTVDAGSAVSISADITDSDGSISNVQIFFDGKRYAHTVSGNTYTAAVPESAVTDGEHTVTVTAVDNDGAKSTAAKKIYARSFVVQNVSITDIGGESPDFSRLKAGDVLKIKIDISSLTTTPSPVAVFAGMYTDRNEMKAFTAGSVLLTPDGAAKTAELSIAVPYNIDTACASVRVYASNGRKTVIAARAGQGE